MCIRDSTIGTPAAIAWLMASFVCGITLSSAATIIIAISVTFAPRARIAVTVLNAHVQKHIDEHDKEEQHQADGIKRLLIQASYTGVGQAGDNAGGERRESPTGALFALLH